MLDVCMKKLNYSRCTDLTLLIPTTRTKPTPMTMPESDPYVPLLARAVMTNIIIIVRAFFLNLKVSSKICSRLHSIFFFFYFSEKTSLDISNLNEMSRLVFSEKLKKKKCHLLQLCWHFKG